MLIDFTEFELETIANAMEDYINYDDEKLDTEFLFGGLSVSDRVTSVSYTHLTLPTTPYV